MLPKKEQISFISEDWICAQNVANMTSKHLNHSVQKTTECIEDSHSKDYHYMNNQKRDYFEGKNVPYNLLQYFINSPPIALICK